MSSRKRKTKSHPFLDFLKCLLILLMLAILSVGGFTFYKLYPELSAIREKAFKTFSNMNESDFRRMTDTEIFDSKGQTIGTISAGHYVYDSIQDISPSIRTAYIDQEDRRFYKHKGVDLIAMSRALVSYVKHRGQVTQGASTITQQVIKNTYLTQERTLERKLTEILIAPEMERQFGKDKILEFYCNGNYFAHGCYGVEAASRYYFGKSAKDVDVWEAALLAGISNRPATYDPIKHPENALKKRNEVLNSMYICKDITEDQLKEYQAKPLDIVAAAAANSTENYETSYAIHCTALELMRSDGFQFQYSFSTQKDYLAYQEKYKDAYAEKSDAIRAGGYKIHTTLDSNIQTILQAHVDDILKKKTEKQENGKYALQSAAAVINNNQNTVVAVVGGRGTDDQYNRAFLSSRQPGSTIKPLIDYGPAFETGSFYPSMVLNDHQWEKGPSNSGDKYYGYVSIREALNRSLNTVAWQILQRIGTETGLSYLSKLHFSTLSWADMTAPAVSIGGFTNGVHVIDMAKGYSTLANGGIYSDKTCLSSVIYDKTGEKLYDGREQKTQVFTAGTAYMLTDVLKGTLDKPYGTGYGLGLDGQEAAGKTGTTNDSKDTWFCGYTSYYTTAVWVGYDTPRAMPGVYGSTYAGAIWHDVMTDLHQGVAKKDFTRPASVIDGNIDSGNGRQVDYDSGETDLFNTEINQVAAAAQKAREATAQSTEEISDNRRSTTAESAAETSPVETTESAAETTTASGKVNPASPTDKGPGVQPTTAKQSSSAEELVGPGVVSPKKKEETTAAKKKESSAAAETEKANSGSSGNSGGVVAGPGA